MKSFVRALRDLDREIAMRENAVEKQKAEIEMMRKRYEAMREFISGMGEIKVSNRTGLSYDKKNLFPAILNFVRNNPNCKVRDIRQSVGGSDTLIRYHLKKQSKFFKRSKDGDGVTTYSLTAKANNSKTDGFSTTVEA